MKKLFFILFGITLFLPQNVFAQTKVKINEFLVHPSDNNEWVEFYNPDNVDLSTYFIDDDESFNEETGKNKKSLSEGLNTQNQQFPFIEVSSFFNNDGDYIVLFDGDGNIVDKYQYIDDPGVDIVIGRSPDGGDNWFELTSQTKGLTNSDPVPSPTPSPTEIPTPTSTIKPINTPIPTKTPTPIKSTVITTTKTPTPTKKTSPTPTKKTTPSPTKKSSDDSDIKLETDVLGETDEKDTDSSKDDKKEKQSNLNPATTVYLIIGSIIVLLSGGLIALQYQDKIKKLFKRNG